MRPIFRNAMFGFHKEDVAKFIASQSKQQERVVADLNREREEMAREFEERIEILQHDADELERLRSLEEKFLSVSGEISQMNENFSKLVEQVKLGLDENDSAISLLEKTNGELVERIKSDSVFREKAKRFDQLSNVLSGIVSGKPLDSSDLVCEEIAEETVEEVPEFDNRKLRADFDELIAFYQKVVKLLSDYSEQ